MIVALASAIQRTVPHWLYPLFCHVLSRWPLVAFAAAAFALGFAHFTEHVLGFEPCRLCLVQRRVLWIALLVAGAASAVFSARWAVMTDHVRGLAWRSGCCALTGVFLVSAGVAGYHAGVEWRIFPDPGCEAGGEAMSAADLRYALSNPGKAVSCVDPPFVFPMKGFGLSMAGWNVVLSLGLAGLSMGAMLQSYGGAGPGRAGFVSGAAPAATPGAPPGAPPGGQSENEANTS